jgi:hypothetical protein
MKRLLKLLILTFALCGTWDGAAVASSISQSPPVNFTCPFTTVTTETCTHGLGTTAVLVTVYDAASPPNLIIPATLKITSANVVTVTFTAAQSGTVVVNAR